MGLFSGERPRSTAAVVALSLGGSPAGTTSDAPIA